MQTVKSAGDEGHLIKADKTIDFGDTQEVLQQCTKISVSAWRLVSCIILSYAVLNTINTIFFYFIFFHIPQKLLLLHVTFSHGCSYPHKTTEILDPRKSMHKVAFPGEKNTNELILHLKYSHLENWTIWNWTLSVLIKGWSHVYFSSKLLLW